MRLLDATKERNCSHCKFYVPRVTFDDGSTTDDGSCRRFPPSPTSESACYGCGELASRRIHLDCCRSAFYVVSCTWNFPEVNRWCICGEFSPKEAELNLPG